mmetsp:Transcript_15062/g.33157  ORF Transcript_15062/g.33157 Transcript_15062/m.33157 type:complete len:119 (-) Transcript_15062:382-738(-)
MCFAETVVAHVATTKCTQIREKALLEEKDDLEHLHLAFELDTCTCCGAEEEVGMMVGDKCGHCSELPAAQQVARPAPGLCNEMVLKLNVDLSECSKCGAEEDEGLLEGGICPLCCLRA